MNLFEARILLLLCALLLVREWRALCMLKRRCCSRVATWNGRAWYSINCLSCTRLVCGCQLVVMRAVWSLCGRIFSLLDLFGLGQLVAEGGGA